MEQRAFTETVAITAGITALNAIVYGSWFKRSLRIFSKILYAHIGLYASGEFICAV
jgi:hypothetical protein